MLDEYVAVATDRDSERPNRRVGGAVGALLRPSHILYHRQAPPGGRRATGYIYQLTPTGG